ncbi:aliphatic sulfonate ABC transporter substrate-binding protein [Nostoc sp. CHAB 5715]|uniref:aliphatic sulfonate ABC transporter substrate-binding protein n=1 Tax=Nostoc sp. CHAB 5715 TaxID=2780400 RepID=UPI001E44269E|nr:aliphatic sulfonate ABC transporter substrate-binding protein [Nostoc sp. CHAB 5715]MCC5626399.1 aliphatic sulfonate ABC transporter substrate-binding protein [Nostoc sp. CHAB 5715]
MPALKGKFEFRKSHRTTRRSLLFALGYCLMLSTALSSCSEAKNNTQQSAASPESVVSSTTEKSTEKQVVRIVRSKQLSALAVLEKQGSLEKRLEPLGFKVQWAEFAAGPQQLEALNANGLDIASTAESPPIFAQAAGTPLVYLITAIPSGKGVSLLVPENSPVKTIADLKGKRVAFQKASIGHYLLVKVLEASGLKLSDVQSVFLPPPDANVAFSQGKVDAWFIWEPFVTRSQQKKIGRVLTDGSKFQDTGGFYSTTRQFQKAHPEVIKIFLEELEKANIWSKNHREEMAKLLAPVTQLDVPTLEIMHAKYEYGLLPITEKVITKQQEVADKWYALGQIPKKVNVRDGFLTPEEYAKITPSEVLAKK